MVVTVIFWALLAGSGTFATTLSGACPRLSPIPHPACSTHRLNEYDMFSAWFNISEHAMNTGYALFEITLTNVGPNSWWHLPICIVVLACYLGVAYITHATQGFYSASPPPLCLPRQHCVRRRDCTYFVWIGELTLFCHLQPTRSWTQRRSTRSSQGTSPASGSQRPSRSFSPKVLSGCACGCQDASLVRVAPQASTGPQLR